MSGQLPTPGQKYTLESIFVIIFVQTTRKSFYWGFSIKMITGSGIVVRARFYPNLMNLLNL